MSGLCASCGGPRFGARFKRTTKSRAYSTPRWRALSKQVRDDWVRRHGPVCSRCRRTVREPGQLHAGHKVPFVDGGPMYDRANLIVLCSVCNAGQSLRDRARRRTTIRKARYVR